MRLPVWVRTCAFKCELLKYVLSQLSYGHRCDLSLGFFSSCCKIAGCIASTAVVRGAKVTRECGNIIWVTGMSPGCEITGVPAKNGNKMLDAAADIPCVDTAGM